MSYQFDATQLRSQTQIKPNRDVTASRLLARRNNRQERRALRAL
ncbi:MAG: hypothetical protein WBF53_05400 [Litorimonas sp.]